MSLTITPVQNRNNYTKAKPLKARGQNASIPRDFSISRDAAMTQKAAIMPAISFGSLKEIALARQFDAVLAKYSKGSTPLVLSAKDGFTRQMAHRIIAEPNKPLIIGVTGQSASGKTTLLAQAQKAIGDNNYRTIREDNYYHDTAQKRIDAGGFINMMKNGHSFDVPESVELDLLSKDLQKLSKGESIPQLHYSFETGARTILPEKIQPAKIIIVDSIFALNEKLTGNLDAGIYVQTPQDLIKERYVKRALEEKRNETAEEALFQLEDVTAKAQEHIVPTAKNASLILSGESPLEQSQEFFRDISKIFH